MISLKNTFLRNKFIFKYDISVQKQYFLSILKHNITNYFQRENTSATNITDNVDKYMLQ